MKSSLLALALILAGTVAGHAQTGLTLGNPTYGGTGCPSGTADVALNGQTLSILYSQFQAEAGGARSFDRKSCNLAIPVHVPNGLSVSVVSVDYRGFNGLPGGASSVFRVEYFFAGGTGPVFNQTFNGPRQQDFTIRNTIVAAANVWSACGQDVTLRTNASIRVTTSGGQQAMATVDTTDVNAAIIFHLQWRAC
jgi:hypothetical protein